MTDNAHLPSDCLGRIQPCICLRELGACNTATAPMRCYWCSHQMPTTGRVTSPTTANFATLSAAPAPNDSFYASWRDLAVPACGFHQHIVDHGFVSIASHVCQSSYCVFAFLAKRASVCGDCLSDICI